MLSKKTEEEVGGDGPHALLFRYMCTFCSNSNSFGSSLALWLVIMCLL